MFKKILRCSSPQRNEGYQSGSIISDISIGSFQHAESRWRGLAIFGGVSTCTIALVMATKRVLRSHFRKGGFIVPGKFLVTGTSDKTRSDMQ